MDKINYTSLNKYLRQTYGEKLYKISLNAGMSCPNRDGTLGTTGCIFCSEGGSGDFAASCNEINITEQIEKAKALISAKTNVSKYIAYFQAFTNTYAPVEYLRKIFYEAINHPDVAILSIGTRCDCLSEEVIDLLKELNSIKPVWIEMGMQSVHNDTLKRMNCCYTYEQFEKAVYSLNEANIEIIGHLILGLPGETKEMMLESVRMLCSLPINGIKLQLLHVLKNTPLEKMYIDNPFPMFELEEYCEMIARCLEIIPSNIVVHRITGDGPKKILVAPLWSADKKKVLNTIKMYVTDED